MPEIEREFLRPARVFALLDISRSRGYEAIQKGEIPSVIIAGQIRIPRRWIMEQQKRAMAERVQEEAD